MDKLVFGCGFLGLRVARCWLQAGHDVFAVTRRQARAAELEALGIRPVVGDLTESISLPRMADLDTVLSAVGYDRTSGKTIDEVYVRGLQRALAALPDSLQRLIHISSTGVYGQSEGEWVHENSLCEPRRVGGVACLAAERLLETHPLWPRTVILRLAGLYGPGRIPKLKAVQAGRPLAVAASGYLNLIHVEDAASIVLAAETKARPPCRYVVADGRPVQHREFYVEVARLLAAPPPRFVDPPDDSPAASRAGSSKRVDTTRLERELSVPLRFPSYREGLRSVIDAAI